MASPVFPSNQFTPSLVTPARPARPRLCNTDRMVLVGGLLQALVYLGVDWPATSSSESVPVEQVAQVKP